VPALGRPESVARLTRAALLERYAAVYRADRMVLAVSGGVPRQRVIAVAERLFKRVPGTADAAMGPATEAAPRGERRLVEREARQAQVLVGFLAPPLTHPTTRRCVCSGCAGRRDVEPALRRAA